jgi:hypothetical protein
LAIPRTRLVQRLKDADSLKPAIIAAREEWHSARRSARTVDHSMRASEAEIGRIQTRLNELQSGRGKRLGGLGFGQATVYEFWLELPGYSGPIAGAFAQLGLQGILNHVSNVSGNTKGGLGTAVVGGLLFGPAGAVGGAIIGRKTTVNTKVQQVDTRQYELQVVGPGYAWSTIGDAAAEYSFRRFRDLVNARSSSTESIEVLIRNTQNQIEQKRKTISSISSSSLSANQKAEAANIKYNRLLGEYQRKRLPLLDDISIRFEESGLGGKLMFLLTGPLPIFLIPRISKAMVDQGIANTNPASFAYIGLACFWFLLFIFYIRCVRLG